MFGLIYNFYKYCKKKTERKITIALLGLDNAGKTTLLNSIQGEVEKDTTPTFGFNTSTLQEGKYKIEVFDLGGGKSIRSVWKKYLAEVHAIVYVVDAADAARFEESNKTITEVLESQYMRDKPMCVFANKQDLPTAASVAEVVRGLGMAGCRNSYNVFACTAKTLSGQNVDARLREGLRWLISSVDRDFGKLDPRVQAEGDEVRQEEARKKKEREERLRKQREERLRLQKEEEDRAREVEKENELHDGKAPSLLGAGGAGAAATVGAGVNGGGQQQQQQELQPLGQNQEPPGEMGMPNGLALGLPHTIESPGKFPPPRRPLDPHPTSDLRPANTDQGATAAAAAASHARSMSGMGPPPARVSSSGAPQLPPARGSLPPLLPPSSDGPGISRPPSAPRYGGGGVSDGRDGESRTGAASTSEAAQGLGPGGGPRPPSAGAARGRSGERDGASGGGGGDGGGSSSNTAMTEAEPGAEGYAARPRLAASPGVSGAGAALGTDGAHSKGSFSLVHTSNKVVPSDSVPGAPEYD